MEIKNLQAGHCLGTSSTFTRVREVGQEVTKKDLEKASGSGGKQTFELFALTRRSIANPATRKSTEFNLGLKELSTTCTRQHVADESKFAL